MARAEGVILCLGVFAPLAPAAAADDWVKEGLKSLPQHVESVMRPGCLLPEPAVLARAPRPRAVLTIAVDTAGRIESSKVQQSTGDAGVDAAIMAAAGECRFEPKYTVVPTTGVKTLQTEFRELAVQWPVPVPSWGAHLCFTPEYPYALRRMEVQGTVSVLATKADAGSAPALTVVEPSSPGKALQAWTVEVVAACFAHPRTHAEMPVQRDFQYRYRWVLY